MVSLSFVSKAQDEALAILRTVARSVFVVRAMASASLQLAYVAAGRLDAFWELGLKPWDIAAGLVLVQEAGGMISEIYGAEDALETGNVLAANPKLHPMLVDALAGVARAAAAREQREG